MTTPSIILVPGFWLGAWAWDEVSATLRDDGHEVTAVTLPGLESAAASVQVSSDLGLPLAVERTQFWGVGSYGGHTESALTGPATRPLCRLLATLKRKSSIDAPRK